MPFYRNEELLNIGFKRCGKNVLISTLAQFYHPELIEISDYVRIDDYCILSNNIKIGNFVHIAARSLIDGGLEGVELSDYSGVAYNCIVIASSDSYHLEGFFGPFCLPEFRKNMINKKVIIGKYSVLGSFSLLMPGVDVAEGCSFGAYSLILKDTEPWSFYHGQPAKKVRDNDKGIIEMARRNTEEIYKMERNSNCKIK